MRIALSKKSEKAFDSLTCSEGSHSFLIIDVPWKTAAEEEAPRRQIQEPLNSRGSFPYQPRSYLVLPWGQDIVWWTMPSPFPSTIRFFSLVSSIRLQKKWLEHTENSYVFPHCSSASFSLLLTLSIIMVHLLLSMNQYWYIINWIPWFTLGFTLCVVCPMGFEECK